MSIRRSLSVFLLLAGLGCGPRLLGQAQSPAPAPAQPQSSAQRRPGQTPSPTPSPSFSKTVNEVNIVFSATTKHHQYITGLTPQYLHVFDNHKPQQIQQLLTEGNVPLRLALVIDTSTSVRTRFHFEQQAAITFFETVLRPGVDKGMVVSFDTNVIVNQPMTGDVHLLAQAIRGLSANGGTALYDAVYDTIAKGLLKSGTPKMRRAIVLISDGDDDASAPGMREKAVALAESAGVVIFSISTDATGMDEHGDSVMRSFAYYTGGQFYYPFRADKLGSMFEQIAYELNHEYLLTYIPNDFELNGDYHAVKIKPISPNIVIRARKGYYAIRTP